MSTTGITSRPIITVFSGTNYVSWSRQMTSYFQSKKLWRVVTGSLSRPVIKEKEDKYAFDLREEDWLCKNCEIITVICNSCTIEITQQFGLYTIGKEIWDFLAKRYTTTDLAHQYQLLRTVLSKRQQPNQSISAFVSEMQSYWDQLTLAAPTTKCHEDAIIAVNHQKHLQLMILLMELQDRFELVRASLLHRSPLPTLEAGITELISEETRIGAPTSPSDEVMVVSGYKGNKKSSVFTPRNNNTNRNSSECNYCHLKGHQFLDFPHRICKFCEKKNSKHYGSDCMQNPNRNKSFSGSTSHSDSSPNPSMVVPGATSVTPDDVISLMKQVMCGSSHSMATSQGSKDEADLWDRP
ncbi:unnamed protein product [Lactuca virosa]|uniref:DUF4219 domain-containing protein n=1 Tax=Lactuca virosa TaxID=75947 RepID=A0AAU9PKP0_9ASTR|nr:unnamed protein product [Lactuca virosa]